MVLRKVPEAGDTGADSPLSGLLQAHHELQQARRIVAGYSGGLDSTVLLHLLHDARSRGELTAAVHVLHVNHAMQADADRWEEHCRQTCGTLGLPFEVVRVPVTAVAGESLEESARNARHAVFASKLAPGDVLALAQHRDDQVETVLFRLLRGSGPAGLAGMPKLRACGAGMLARPLLNTPRAELLHYARARKLAWIDDRSNADQRFDRNFLRCTVLPLLQQRWPGLAGTVTRSAQLSSEAALLLDDLAANDLHTMAAAAESQLPIEALSTLSAIRQRNVLRYWLHAFCTRKSLAVPTYQVLSRVISEVVSAAPDGAPMLRWGEGDKTVELRRYRGTLHVCAALPSAPRAIDWVTRDALVLPAPLGMLELRDHSNGKGLARKRVSELRVCFRSGGELVKPAGRPTRALKKVLQETGIPPWLRERIPLLYAGDELVAVADLLICEGWLAESSETACRVTWRHPDLDCGYPPHLLI